MEIWRSIPNCGYEASSLGRIRRVGGEPLAQNVTRKYLAVKMYFLDEPKMVYVHRLVCLAFNGVKPTGADCVRHLDGNELNNVPSNLRWGTRKENAQDTTLHGRQVCGFDHPNMKITKGEARVIRAEYLKATQGRKKAPNGLILKLVESYPHLGYKCVRKAATGAYDGME